MLTRDSKITMRIIKIKSVIYPLLITIGFFLFLEGVSYLLIAKYAETGTFSERTINSVFHPFRGWVTPKNSLVKTSKPFFGYSKKTFVETDGDGWVVTPLSLEKPSIKIAILGGSSVFGVGSTSSAATIPSQLEYLLYHKFGVRSEVTNLGVRGYNSFQELVTLNEFLLTKKVDLVITLTGFNDAKISFDNDNIIFSLLPRHVFEVSVPLVRKAQKQQPVILNVEGFLRQHSYFFDISFRLLYRIIGQPNQLISRNFKEDFESIEKRADITYRNYRMMKVLAEAAGAKFIFALQPSAYHLSDYPRDIAYLKNNLDGHKLRKKYIKKFLDILALRCADLNLYDLRGVLNDLQEKPFVDSIHYTDKAAAYLGDKLATHVTKLFK